MTSLGSPLSTVIKGGTDGWEKDLLYRCLPSIGNFYDTLFYNYNHGVLGHDGMSMDQTVVQVAFELSDRQAAALAEFLERSTFSDFQKRARNINEAHNMADAASRLRKALAALSRSRASQLIG